MKKTKANQKAIFIAIIMLTSIFASLSMNEIQIAKADQTWEGGKTITGSEEYSNETIIVQGGDLVIQSGGTLTLRNITLKMEARSGFGGQRRWIDVQSGGALYVYDNDNNPQTTEDGSLITRRDGDGDRYRFRVRSGGILVIKNSEIQNCGRSTGFDENRGLYIESNNVIIENNTFRNNYRGIQLTSNVNNVKIVNNNFQDILSGGNGIRFLGADNNVKIDRNTFNVPSSNEDAFRGTSSSTNNKGYNSTFAGSGYYVNLDGGSSLILVNSTNQGSGGVSISSDSTLILKNFLEVEVVDENNNSIENATVIVREDGFEVFNGNTNSQGKISWIEVAFRKYEGSNQPIPINVEVEVNYPDYNFSDNPRTVNMGNSHTELFIGEVSNYPPNITSSPITKVNEDELYEYQVNATDQDGDNITFSLQTSPEKMNISAISNNSALIQWIPENEDVGNHKIEINATDERGKYTLQIYNLTVINVNDVPIIQGVPNLTIPAEYNYTYDISPYISDVDNSTEQLTISTNSSYISVNGTILIFSHPRTMDYEIVNITVSDGLLSSSQEVNFTIFYNEPPTIANVPDQNGTEDIEWTFDIFSYVNDTDNGTANLTISVNSIYISVNSFNLTFLYPNGITYERVKITVSDGWCYAFQEINVSITPIDDPPIIYPIGDLYLIEDIPYILYISDHVYDEEENIIMINVSSQNVIINLTADTFTFLYTNQSISFEQVILNVSDETSTVQQTINVSITFVNDRPIISGVPDQYNFGNTPWNLDITQYLYDEDNTIEQLNITTNSSYITVNGTILTFFYGTIGLKRDYVNITVSDGFLNSSQNIVVYLMYYPEIKGVPDLNLIEDIPYQLNTLPYISDFDNTTEQLRIFVDSLYINNNFVNISINDKIITFLYGEGILYDIVNITVSDGILSSFQIINITITPVNDAPIILSIPNLTLYEDISFELNLSEYIYDIDGSDIDLLVSISSPYVTLKGKILTFLYPEGITEDLVKILVTDVSDENNLLSGFAIINITIIPVNDQPIIKEIPTQYGIEDISWQLNLTEYIYDIDNLTEQLILTLNSSYVSINDFILTFLYPNGILYDEVNITISDGMNSTNKTIFVFITPINDLPSILITFPKSNTIITKTITIYGKADDIDDEEIKIYIKINNEEWKLIEGGRGWKYAWDTTNYKDGEYTIYAMASDGKDNSTIVSIKLIVKHSYDFTLNLKEGMNEFYQNESKIYFLEIENKGDSFNEIQLNVSIPDDLSIEFNNSILLNLNEKKTLYLIIKTHENSEIKEYTISLIATSKNDSNVKKTLEFKIKVIKLNPKLSIKVDFPINNTEVKGKIGLFGTASPFEIEGVEFTLNYNWISVELKSYKDGKWNWNYELDTTKLNDGEHLLSFRAKDKNSYSKTIDIVIIINQKLINTLPNVNISYPKNEKVSGKIVIYGTASDNFYIAKVQIKIDDSEWKEVVGTYFWSFSLDTTKLNDGEHTIYVRAYDGMDYSESSTTIIVENKKEWFKLPETVPFSYLLIAFAIIIILGLLLIRNMKIGMKLEKTQQKQKEKVSKEFKEEEKEEIEDKEIAEYYNSLSEEDKRLVSKQEVNSIIKFYGSVIAKSVIDVRIQDRKKKDDFIEEN